MLNNLSFANVEFYSTYYLINWSSVRWFLVLQNNFR